MKNRALVALGIASSLGIGFVACVGDSSTPSDAGTDATNDVGSGADATQDGAKDVTTDTTTSDVAADVVEAGPCSDPLVGGTVNIPTGTFNASVVVQSDPLLGGDYFLTSLSVYNNCAINCPAPHKGTIFGGLKITSLGSGKYLVERHVEMQQTNKSVRNDAFTATFDQLAKTLTVSETCSADGGISGDGGQVWTAVVSQTVDGGFNISQPDLPVELVMPDGGAAGNGAAYTFYLRQ